MIDSLTTANHRDFNARYRGTYGWYLKDDHQRVLTYIAEVDQGQVAFQDVRGMLYYAYADKGSKFEFLPVTRGWFYGKSGEMYLLSRRPARQWHRGICANNTTVQMVRRHEIRAQDVTIHTLSDVFDNVANNAYTYEEGKNCILSKQFAIVGKYLYLYDRVIGEVKDKTIVLLEGAHILRQELLDVIKRNGYTLSV